MAKRSLPFYSIACSLACVLLLTACSPKYDWREVRGADASFSVALPAKPASHSRSINLGGIRVTMTMIAADVEDATFAVGTAELPDAAQAASALAAMKTALTRNIGGTVRRETASAPGSTPITIEIEAVGASGAQGDRPTLLIARLIASGKRVYQLVVVGKEGRIPREAVDMFFTSFKAA